jgi:hypothetical protein
MQNPAKGKNETDHSIFPPSSIQVCQTDEFETTMKADGYGKGRTKISH